MTDYWLACLQAAQLITLAPHQFGGVIVRARSGPVRERWLRIFEQLAQHKGLTTPIRKIPGTISDENLLGGLDIENTITRGKPVFRPGLLSHCDQSLAILPMAERVDIGVAARLASALDHGSIQVERDGHSQTLSCAMGLIALDESIEDDESINPKLAERCAFHIDLDAIQRQAEETMRNMQDAGQEFDPQNAESFTIALNNGLFTPEESPQQAAALEKLETALALIDGWVEEVISLAADNRLPSLASLSELLRRERVSNSPIQQLFKALFNLEVSPKRVREATFFWREIRVNRDLDQRDKIWSGLLPTEKDLSDPIAFIGSTEIPDDISKLFDN